MSGSRPPFRQILPQPTAPPVTKKQPAKRRKIANACDCDGVRPKCSNCVNTNVECIFSAEVAAAQAAQEKDAESARTARYQGVIDLLRNGNLTDSIQALQNLRGAENLDDAMSAIAEARLLLPVPGPGAVATTAARSEAVGSGTRRRSSPLLRSPYDDSDYVFEKQYMVTPRDQYVDKDMFVDLSSRTLPLSRWTAASSDNRLMNHLLTLFAMFVYEGNLGSGKESLQYLMRSFEEYRALNEGDNLARDGMDEARLEHERQAISWCMWGFYCSEWRASQALGFPKPALKPRVGKAWREPKFRLSQPDSIGYWWFPYPMSVNTQRSMQVEVREVNVGLSELVEEVLKFTFPEEGRLPTVARHERALELYDALVDWKMSLPARIRYEEAVLGSTIVLHVAVELLMANLLRPYSGMTKQEFGRFNPRDRCFAHACSIMSAVWTFRSLSCIRFEYWLVHPIGTAAFMVLHRDDEGGGLGALAPAHMDTIVRACQCLTEMKGMLPLATDVLSGIRAAFYRCRLPVPAYLGRYFDAVRHRRDGLMHHAFAALLPTAGGEGDGSAEMQLQELLDEFDGLGVGID